MNNKIDLPEHVVRRLISVFASYPEIEKVIIFGSRVLGNAKPGSDVDCALSGKKLSPQIVGKVHNHLEEETLLPYFFDCIHLESIQNNDLREHIKKYGKILYKQSAAEKCCSHSNRKDT